MYMDFKFNDIVVNNLNNKTFLWHKLDLISLDTM